MSAGSKVEPAPSPASDRRDGLPSWLAAPARAVASAEHSADLAPCREARRSGTPREGARVAIVHEWLDTYAGSERVLEELLVCFPEADLFAVADFLAPEDRGFLQGRPVRTSFIQRLPFSRRLLRKYLPLMPIAMEQLDLRGYDLVLSSNHAVAKGILTGPDQLHVSYMHSPMRYAWDLQHQYLGQAGLDYGLKGLYARWMLAKMRGWDARSATGVDNFVANSRYIARRIRKAYGRESVVIHPPVDLDRFRMVDGKDDYFLLASRFVPYKRADLVVESFARQPHRRLVVVGDGPERDRVRRAAQGAANIEFRGFVEQAHMVELMQRARAFVFAAEEDFGIAMVEAQACGTPVIAYGRGGAEDIVRPPEIENPTGILFMRQAADAVTEAVARFEAMRWRITPEACRANAMRFSKARFRSEMLALVDRVWPSPGMADRGAARSAVTRPAPLVLPAVMAMEAAPE